MSVFIDTNVFVYAVDPLDPEKQARAREVLRRVGMAGQGVISTQVAAEFTAVVSRRAGRSSARTAVSRTARLMLDVWRVEPVDTAVVSAALALHERQAMSYWDAQILASAKLAGCSVLLTEDVLAPRLLGVEYLNPFTEGFDVAGLETE